jgi:hypothetical protein
MRFVGRIKPDDPMGPITRWGSASHLRVGATGFEPVIALDKVDGLGGVTRIDLGAGRSCCAESASVPCKLAPVVLNYRSSESMRYRNPMRRTRMPCQPGQSTRRTRRVLDS